MYSNALVFLLLTIALASNSVFAFPAKVHHAHSPFPHRSSANEEFFVDGAHIPGVDFEVANSYAGLLPVSNDAQASRKLFWWYYPPEGDVGHDDLTIWLNGGPGCSSLLGAMQENGPFLVSAGTKKAEANPYSWTKLSHVLWIDQPAGAGLSQGGPDISSEQDVAREFYGFLINFFATFPELMNKRVWLTGESYAGMYISYIADDLLHNHSVEENRKNGINYQGFGLIDAVLSDSQVTIAVITEFAVRNQKLLQLNDTFVSNLQADAQQHGVATFVADSLQYPPQAPIRFPDGMATFDGFADVYYAALDVNPCFSVYDIRERCPTATDPLGLSAMEGRSSSNNFINETPGFKAYVHADPNTDWLACKKGVFKNDDPTSMTDGEADQSGTPDRNGLLQRIIDDSPAHRNVIQNGEMDMLIMADEIAVVLQNSMWGGKQGYQRPPTRQLVVDGREAGSLQCERGLAFLRVKDSGHQVPIGQPAVAYKMQQYLLGQISEEQLYG